MSDSLADMMVSFSLDLTNLNSAPSATSEVFNAMAASAASASEEISASFDVSSRAANSFAEMTQMAAENAAEALGTAPVEALSELASASEEDAASISESFSSIKFDAFQGALVSLTEAVDAAVSQIDERLATIPAEAEDSATKSESAFSGFNLGGLVNQVGMGIFAFQNIANMATNVATSLLQPAMNAENMQASFTNLTGSAQVASDELSKLSDFAAQTQFTTMDIDQAGAQLLGFGFKASSIIPDIKAIGDNLSAVGKGTPAEIQSVVDIFGKMSTQGKLTGADITQLGAHGITALADIAAGSGKTTKQIQDMIANGTLPAKQAIDDLTKGIEGNPIYSGGMAKQSGTLQGIMSTLHSDWDDFLATVVKPMLPGIEDGLKKLTTLLTDPTFKAFAKTLGSDIVGGVKTLSTDIGKLVDGGKSVVDFFKHNQDAMDALDATLLTGGGILLALIIPALATMGAELLVTAAGAIATAAPFILFGLIVGAVIFGIIEAIQHWGAIAHWLQDIWKDVQTFWHDNITVPFQNGLKAAGDAFDGFKKGAANAWNGVVNTVKGGINDIIGGINSFIGFVDSIQIHIPSVGVGPLKTPAFDWNGLGIPKIPLLATGGFVPPGGVAIAGDPGPNSELVFGGTSGASVLSHAQSAGLMGGEVHVHNHNHIYIDGHEMSNQLMVQVLSQVRSSGHPLQGIA